MRMHRITMMDAAAACAAGILMTASGCGSSHSSHLHAAAASHSAQARAFATSSAGQLDKAEAQKLAKKCLPQSDSGLIALMGAGGHSRRQQVITCARIPPQDKAAFEDGLLTSGAKLITSGGIYHSAQRQAFYEVTVPALFMKYHG